MTEIKNAGQGEPSPRPSTFDGATPTMDLGNATGGDNWGKSVSGGEAEPTPLPCPFCGIPIDSVEDGLIWHPFHDSCPLTNGFFRQAVWNRRCVPSPSPEEVVARIDIKTGRAIEILGVPSPSTVGTPKDAVQDTQALRTAVEGVEKVIGCGDNSCLFKKREGAGTNGGCRCGDRGMQRGRLALLYRAAQDFVASRGDSGEIECPGCSEVAGNSVKHSPPLCTKYPKLPVARSGEIQRAQIVAVSRVLLEETGFGPAACSILARKILAAMGSPSPSSAPSKAEREIREMGSARCFSVQRGWQCTGSPSHVGRHRNGNHAWTTEEETGMADRPSAPSPEK